MIIAAKLDVLKIDKARLYKGEKGTYLDINLIETPDDQYGNAYMVVQAVTKEERLAGVRGKILGNAKIIGKKDASAPAAAAKPASQPNDDLTDVPF